MSSTKFTERVGTCEACGHDITYRVTETRAFGYTTTKRLGPKCSPGCQMNNPTGTRITR